MGKIPKDQRSKQLSKPRHLLSHFAPAPRQAATQAAQLLFPLADWGTQRGSLCRGGGSRKCAETDRSTRAPSGESQQVGEPCVAPGSFDPERAQWSLHNRGTWPRGPGGSSQPSGLLLCRLSLCTTCLGPSALLYLRQGTVPRLKGLGRSVHIRRFLLFPLRMAVTPLMWLACKGKGTGPGRLLADCGGTFSVAGGFCKGWQGLLRTDGLYRYFPMLPLRFQIGI